MELSSYLLGKKSSGGGGGGAEEYFASTTANSQLAKIIKKLPPLELTANSNFNAVFQNSTNLIEVQMLDISKALYANNLFGGCSNLETANIKTGPSLTDAGNLFYNCSKLKNVPELDFTNITTAVNAYYNCSSLTDESINNILASLAKTTKYAQSKKLSACGFYDSWAPASRIRGLSNYQTFINAGWTIGYN